MACIFVEGEYNTNYSSVHSKFPKGEDDNYYRSLLNILDHDHNNDDIIMFVSFVGI